MSTGGKSRKSARIRTFGIIAVIKVLLKTLDSPSEFSLIQRTVSNSPEASHANKIGSGGEYTVVPVGGPRKFMLLDWAGSQSRTIKEMNYIQC